MTPLRWLVVIGAVSVALIFVPIAEAIRLFWQEGKP